MNADQARRRKWIQDRRLRLAAAGLCIDCGKAPPKKTAQRCDGCAEKLCAVQRSRRVKVRGDRALADGMPISEIAVELGITRSAAHMTLVRALRKVAKACRRYDIEPGDIVGRQAASSMIILLERWA